MYSTSSSIIPTIIITGLSIVITVLILRYVIEKAVQSALSKELKSLKSTLLLSILFKDRNVSIDDFSKANKIVELEKELSEIYSHLDGGYIKKEKFEVKKKEILDQYEKIISE